MLFERFPAGRCNAMCGCGCGLRIAGMLALAQCQASCGSDLLPVLHFALNELGQPVVTKCANGMRLERAYYSIIIISKIIIGYLAYYYPILFATHFGPVLESEHMHTIHVPPTYGSLPRGDDLAFVSQQTAKCRTVVFILVVVKKKGLLHQHV